MMRKRLTKPSPKTALSSDQLQVLVTELTEAKEGAISGGTSFSSRIRLFAAATPGSNDDLDDSISGAIRTTFSF